MRYVLSLMLMAMSFNAFSQTSSLIVQDEDRRISVAWLIKEGINVESSYGLQSFCYSGNIEEVVHMITKWNDQGLFLSQDGEGFELIELEIIRGFATYDIRMILENELMRGQFETVLVKPCR
jgi:hypothetical protein